MTLIRRHALALVVLLAAAAAQAQAPKFSGLHIGYVYPAGGQQGTSFEAVIAGQFMANVDQVFVSGYGVTVKIREFIRPVTGKETNALRIELDQLLARKAVVRNDFKALEQFRSFKKAKGVKDKPTGDDEIEALKKKYAGATWTAEDEKHMLEVRRKIGSGVRRPANPAICELAIAEVTVAADASPGLRELRVGSPASLSNPLVFHVGSLKEFSKAASKSISEQKSQVAKTAVAPKARKLEELKVTLPAVVNGQILAGAVDRFRFDARKGQRLVATVCARDLIPYIADAVPGWFQATLGIYDAEGKEIAYNDDFRFNPDPVVYCEIPADGEYVAEIKDSIYRGREDFVYRITIGELPFVTGVFPLGGQAGTKTALEVTGWNLPATKATEDSAGRTPGIYWFALGRGATTSNRVPFAVDTLPECLDKEPNDDPAHAQRVTLPVIVNGRIGRPGDVDVFRFEGHKGEEVVAEVLARRLGSPLDSILRLTDAAGKQLAANDDYEDKAAGLLIHQADSLLSVTLTSDGTYYLHLADGERQGGPDYAYRLRISRPRPDFELRVVPASVNGRPGGTATVTVHAVRCDGFSEAIALALKDPPEGFSLRAAEIPAKQDQAKITLNVPRTPQKEPVCLHFEGRATIAGREVVHPAVPAEDMMQAFAYHHLVPAENLEAIVGGYAMGTKPNKPFKPGAKPGKPGGKPFTAAAFKVVSALPVKIPAGGTAKVKLSMPGKAALAKIRLVVTQPAQGIKVKNAWGSGEGVATIIFESDAAKVAPGSKGSLVLTAYSEKGSSSSDPSQAKPSHVPLATLPAIPFEIVGK